MKAAAMLLIGLMSAVSIASAAEMKYKVVVADFGTFQSIDIDELKAEGSEKSLNAYVVDSLKDTQMFSVFSLRREELEAVQAKYAGKLVPSDVKKLGAVLNVPYIICGNVMNISPIESECTVLTGGVNIYSVRAKIALLMMDTATGKIVKGAMGEGTSSSSRVKVGSGVHTLSIGVTKVAESSVTNALQKAAEAAVDKLVLELGKGGR